MSKVCYNGKYPAETFESRDGKLFCIECGEWLPIVMFGKRRSTKRGYNMCCKRCYTTSTENCNGEVWIDVVGFEGFYKVSRTGKILSCERIITNKGKSVYLPAKIHNQRLNAQGYLTVILSKDGHSKNCLVHRLVAMAFLPNPNKHDCVNHKNEVKIDNRVENLEWCSREYNNNYGTRNARISEKHSGSHRNTTHVANMVKAQRKKMCPVIQEDDCGHIVGWYRTVAEAIEETGIRHIHSALYRNGKAGGFNWRKISEDCFKALAAINDENDLNQWYVCDVPYWCDLRQGDWVIKRDTMDHTTFFPSVFHKATAEEIIKHFKEK